MYGPEKTKTRALVEKTTTTTIIEKIIPCLTIDHWISTFLSIKHKDNINNYLKNESHCIQSRYDMVTRHLKIIAVKNQKELQQPKLEHSKTMPEKSQKSNKKSKILFTDSDDENDDIEEIQEQFEIEDAIEREINHYFAFDLKTIDKNELKAYKTNPMLFWKEYNNIYPILSQISVLFFSGIAGSHPSESVFSKAGYVLNPRRISLLPQNVDSILFSNCVELIIKKLKERNSDLLQFFQTKN